MLITFHFLQPVQLARRKKIKALLLKLFSRENTEVESLDVIFCSDAYLLEMNNIYLSHDDFTDIITFNLASPGLPVCGELYISVTRARENANQYNVLINNELCRLIIHGCLHLAGFSDKGIPKKTRMTQKENEYLSLLESL